MADVRPFRAVRFSRSAGPLPALVAPPYDVISESDRRRLAERNEHNVVHLTLNQSEEDAGALYRSWLDEGVLVADDDQSAWVVVQDYVGPDGVARRREGLVASLRVEPYDTRTILPHERTHAGPKESRLRLLRASQAQLEPIFLLYDGQSPVAPPERDPDLAAEDTALWRIDGHELATYFADRQLLIADGHHRYETAVAYSAEQGTPEAARMLVVLVSTQDPGLEIFPTHRTFAGRADITVDGERFGEVDDALRVLAELSYDRAAAVVVTPDGALLVRGAVNELDVELVDRFGHEGIGYTPDVAAARQAVQSGDATHAFLLRATRIEDVFARARDGVVMPQKTTYFYPKLISGLLFHPV